MQSKCKYCNTPHPEDQIANPHYCIARMGEEIAELKSCKTLLEEYINKPPGEREVCVGCFYPGKVKELEEQLQIVSTGGSCSGMGGGGKFVYQREGLDFGGGGGSPGGCKGMKGGGGGGGNKGVAEKAAIGGNGAYDCDNNALGEIIRLRERVKDLEADALVMALRLFGDDDITFGPECHEVMQRWGKIAMGAIGGNGMVAGGLSPDKRR